MQFLHGAPVVTMEHRSPPAGWLRRVEREEVRDATIHFGIRDGKHAADR
jgi:hypothetical protein